MSNQNTDKATARPWHVSKYKNGFNIEVCANDGCVCTVLGTSGTNLETSANAALIVRAVNEHAALVAVADLMDLVLQYHRDSKTPDEFAGLFDRFILEKARNLAAVREGMA